MDAFRSDCGWGAKITLVYQWQVSHLSFRSVALLTSAHNVRVHLTIGQAEMFRRIREQSDTILAGWTPIGIWIPPTDVVHSQYKMLILRCMNSYEPKDGWALFGNCTAERRELKVHSIY